MKLRHKTPCSECPWLKTSAAGWLGGFSPESYADAVTCNEIPACHNSDYGPDNPKSSMCVGALATATNSCIKADKTSGAMVAQKLIGKRDDCFQWVRDFYEHHTKKTYVPFYQRFLTTPRDDGR